MWHATSFHFLISPGSFDWMLLPRFDIFPKKNYMIKHWDSIKSDISHTEWLASTWHGKVVTSSMRFLSFLGVPYCCASLNGPPEKSHAKVTGVVFLQLPIDFLIMAVLKKWSTYCVLSLWVGGFYLIDWTSTSTSIPSVLLAMGLLRVAHCCLPGATSEQWSPIK